MTFKNKKRGNYMGCLWQCSFTALNIPHSRIEEIKEIIGDILSNDFTYSHNEEDNTHDIEMWDYKIYASFYFEKWAIEELKSRLWKNEFIEFKCTIEVAEEFDPRLFNYNDYLEYKTI